MRTVHRWFRSGSYSLLGHAFIPESFGRVGLLVVPPFGFEDICFYRPLRCLARKLADAGIPVLRFDLPGTGDSSGGPFDRGLVEAWIDAVAHAAAELRAGTGVDDVAVLGVRLGGLLATLAALRGADVQDLILWGAPSSGRAELRELRAFANMERREYANLSATPPQPEPGFEVGGFLLTPETKRDLQALDASELRGLRARRVLLLSRDNVQPDSALRRAFESVGCAVSVGTGSGYSALMMGNHDVALPDETPMRVVGFLGGGQAERISVSSRPNGLRSASSGGAGEAVVEAVHTIQTSAGQMFGVLTEPPSRLPRADWCLVFLNAGGVRHIGPNRMWVEIARRWAARGVVSLRLDLFGIGESDGEPVLDTPALYQEQLADQVELAIDSLRSRLGLERFAAMGLCSGAFWAFHAVIRHPRIRAAILLNPRLFFWDPEVDRRRMRRRATKALINWSDWYRMARGGVRMELVKRAARALLDRSGPPLIGRAPRQIPPHKMAEAWKTIERHGTRLALVFTEGEPLLCEMEEEGQMPPATNAVIRCVRVPNAGHTFRPRWAQKLVHEIIDGELNAVARESGLDSVAKAI